MFLLVLKQPFNPPSRSLILGADSVTAPYWMTSSARNSTDGGIVRPRDFAAFRLITSSNFVGCSTGRLPGLVPFKILSTKPAARRQTSLRSAPYETSPPASTYGRSTYMAG